MFSLFFFFFSQKVVELLRDLKVSFYLPGLVFFLVSEMAPEQNLLEYYPTVAAAPAALRTTLHSPA